MIPELQMTDGGVPEKKFLSTLKLLPGSAVMLGIVPVKTFPSRKSVLSKVRLAIVLGREPDSWLDRGYEAGEAWSKPQ